MGQNVTASIKCPIGIVETPTSGPLTGVAIPFGPNFQTVLKLSGVAADQVDTVYDQTLTFSAWATPQTLALDASGTNDPLGNPNTFARVRVMAFRNKSATDGHVLLVGGAGSDAFEGWISTAGTITVYPSSAVNDGWTIITAPNTTGIVVGGSAYNLKLNPGTYSDIVADVVILGCSS